MATLAELTIRIIEEERAKEATQAAMEIAEARKILRDDRREKNGYAQNDVHATGKNFVEQAS